MDKKTTILIGIIFLIAIIIRIFFSVPNETFNDSDSYYSLRQLKSIEENKYLLYEDPLSFSGKEFSFMPGFYVLMGIPYLFFQNIIIIKIISIILISLTTIIIFLISKKLTNNKNIALFTSFGSIFIPILLSKTTNNITTINLTIPLVLLALYLFSEYGKSSTKSFLYISFLFALALVSAHSLIFLTSIFMYTILLKIEKISISKNKQEITIFSTIFLVWINLIFFKKALQSHGINIIWQNIPNDIVFNYFSSLNMVNIIFFIGIIPFVLALYGIYNNLFKTKKEELYIYAGFITTIFFLLLLRLVKLETGLIYLGLAFMIFSSLGIKDLITYIKKTKSVKYIKIIFAGIFILFIITSIIPTIQAINNKNHISPETIQALKWIKNKTPNTSIILGTINEGHLISEIAERKNVIDTNFLLQKNINDRYNDIELIYTSSLAIKAIEASNRYNINYILFDDAKNYYNINSLKYKDSSLLELVYSNKKVDIYKIKGRVEKYEQ